MQIEVDFDVWKTLTAHRTTERVTYNDVLRELLKLGPATHAPNIAGPGPGPELLGYNAVGRHLPHGTGLRVRYKGTSYTGEVRNGLIVAEGRTFKSLSAAAKGITRTNVNGLRFWEAKRPGDDSWTLVAALRKDAE